MTQPTPIAVELLEAERERLVRDHYDDLSDSDCDGCQRAYAVARELAALRGRKHEPRP